MAESTKSGTDAANLCTETVSTVWYCSIMEKPGSANSSSELRGDYTHADARYTVPQDHSAYTDAEHDRWRRLYAQQVKLAEKHAARAFRNGLARLDCADGIPDFERASRILDEATGWRIVAVPGFIPDEVFFDHLANRRFPVTRWIREEHELDYLVEPDVFHDFFGHVPMLLDPTFADFMAAYGAAGARAQAMDAVPMLARIYWYTVEFGLIREAGALRIYGAGIVSSFAESVFALDSDSPNRIGFDLARVMRTDYRIDDFQQNYFVIDSLEQLLDVTVNTDFAPIYAANAALPPIPIADILPGDEVITRGTQDYATAKA